MIVFLTHFHWLSLFQINFTILAWAFFDTLHLQCFLMVTVRTLCLSRQTCLITHSSEHHTISLDVFPKSKTYIIKNSQDTPHFLHGKNWKTCHFTSELYLIFCYSNLSHIRFNVWLISCCGECFFSNDRSASISGSGCWWRTQRKAILEFFTMGANFG